MEASPHNPARLLDDAPGLALDIVNTLREPLLVLDAQLRVTGGESVVLQDIQGRAGRDDRAAGLRTGRRAVGHPRPADVA
jgi:hypothetical protein